MRRATRNCVAVRLALAMASAAGTLNATAGVVFLDRASANAPHAFPAAREATPPCPQTAAAVGRRTALLVAIGEYESPEIADLNGPINDAILVGAALKKQGFELNVAVNPTEQALFDALDRTIAAASCGDRVFLGISSHGALVERTPMILASDSVIPDESCDSHPCAVRDIDLASAVVAIRNRGAHVFVLLDTHYTGLFRLVQLSANEVGDLWRWPPEVEGGALELQPGAGTVTVFGSGTVAYELPLPLDAEEQDVYGAFSFAVASAINEDSAATTRQLAERAATIYGPLTERKERGTYESTAAQLAFFASAQSGTRGDPTAAGTLRFEILAPRPTRGVVAVPSPTVRLEGRLLEPRAPEALLVAGQLVATIGGRFSAEVTLSSSQATIPLLGVFRNGEQVELRSAEIALDWSNVSTAQQFNAGKRVALLVANTDYGGSGFANLVTPGTDVDAVAKVLRERYGFETELKLADDRVLPLVLKNANERQIMSTLNKLQQLLTGEDSLLIFYAGHGMFSKEVDQAYWIPRDGLRDDMTTWISAHDITDMLKLIPARHVLLVADSCYSGGLNRGDPGGPADAVSGPRREMLTKMHARHSRYLLSSGEIEPVADGGGLGHSVFAGAFLKGLNEMAEPEFTANELYDDYLVEAVAGGSEQIPQLQPIRDSGHEGGGFVFVKTQATPP